jgi:broad specificity phosphatase PhoE
MTKLVLCRHAEPSNEDQARALVAELAQFALAAVYTSPLVRAADTARVVAEPHSLTPIELDALAEIDFGDADGLTFDDLPAELQEGLLRDPTTVGFPGGETYPELQQRVCAALDAIVANHAGDAVAVITHAGPIRAALARWLCMDGGAVFRIDQRFASVNIVEWLDGVPFVRLVNG